MTERSADGAGQPRATGQEALVPDRSGRRALFQRPSPLGVIESLMTIVFDKRRLGLYREPRIMTIILNKAGVGPASQPKVTK